ncbi:N-acetylglucosamine-6-phosphate deacetylase [Pendulispora rubella]|uniref:N-acetylglucosamine-6-phosphate deacetylase n=1 Tax=Pendulispora rubella TaxID=2741070 RepID=A0ABZ2L945_9BACT
MTLHSLAGNILTPSGWLRGRIAFKEHIEVVEGEPVDPEQAGQSSHTGNGDLFVLPGFMDLHVHGGGGRDVMEGGDAARTIAKMHARHGTTSMLATTMTAPSAEIEKALTAVGPTCREHISGGARVLGVHLEGPYINSGKLGAQPSNVRVAVMHELDRYNAMAPIRVLTLAPEITGHLEAIRAISAKGIRVQIGHTAGSYEDSVAALEHGAAGFTHLFNAMTGLHHREPGAVGAALAHAEYAELIPDLRHVHPGAMRAAFRTIPRLFAVTDSTAAAGMPDGEYRLGSNTVTKCLGAVRLSDGTIAGSALTMDQALRNLVQSVGLRIEDASRRLSFYPAEYLNLKDRGRLEQGAWADVVVVDRELKVVTVFGEGECLWAR